ncbi:cytochrome P450 [Corynebacterium guangdongense]|uniref:Cytochrome P450/ferredoxin-NADP reductase n=1 Tax=Corynebacterium guangdongense TaxID=1783348 RepID=A0ABU1ZTX2_9CORY|nr:cytochrome P450 [Corynebacterium guangdongense]MDR7328372.1 cytochrome P450/ferredoxin-NADP reductase [Corynebacterium guangdongense]WJZ16949.1 Phthalate 4,5-dioxygenase oxygenase reductase subunit [Corynebacterium guangdongense]
MTTATTGKCPVAHGFDAMADPYYVDPAKYLKPFSDEHPVFFYEHMNAWIVTRREDALEVLSDWQRYSSTANSAEIEIPAEHRHVISPELMQTMLLGSDPDGHTRHRAVSQMGFLAEDMDALAPEIEARAHRIIDTFENDGRAELIGAYCLELTTQTLLAHMGLGYEYADFIKQLRDDFFMVLSSAHEPFEEPLRSQVWNRYIESNLLLRELVEQRRESADRDLISIMASQKNPDGSWALGADEIALHLTEFAAAGTDTTAQAMANAIIFLQANPEAREEALAEPELWPRVFIETIRRRNSSTFTGRLAKVDTEISGVPIKAGDRVLISLTSANTDESFFARPLDFDIHRPNLDEHLSFSTGRHKCLGNPLAKVQAPAGLRVLFERLPSLRVDDPEAVDFVKFALLPARRSLPVSWDVADVERTSKQSIRTLNLTVARRTVESDGVVSLTLAHPDGGELPRWKPGAHIDLHLPGKDANGEDIVRQYSLSGDPEDRQTYRVGVLREADGKGGSVAVHDRVHEGDTITVSWPRNNFRFADAGAYLFIAGGIGITPILPMVRQAQAAGKPWKLVYGGRTRGSMAFRQELAPYGENVELIPQDELGHIDLPGILERVQDDVLIYACGPAGLLDAAEANAAHWPANSLRLERFTPKEIVRDYADAAFEVEFADSEVTVTVGAEETILDAAEKAGLTTISSCRTGTCGTCETRLISGEADHRDSILTPDEQAANDTMMICVSRAAQGCPRLVLDR